MSINFDLNQFLIGSALGFLLVVLSFRFKLLTFSGSVATLILAILIFGFGGWAWTVPILVFFVLSSLLSKTGKSHKAKFKNTFEKTGVRDYTQVFANGGLAGLFMLIWIFNPLPIFYHLYLVALAAATADTWATEIGVLSKTNPILITTFKEVKPGISGGISFYGTLASFTGSFILASIGYLFGTDIPTTILVGLAGFSGSLIDSILGATVQGQYRCTICNSYTEKRLHCNSATDRTRGIKWFGNDLVNICSEIGACFVFYFLFLI